MYRTISVIRPRAKSRPVAAYPASRPYGCGGSCVSGATLVAIRRLGPPLNQLATFAIDTINHAQGRKITERDLQNVEGLIRLAQFLGHFADQWFAPACHLVSFRLTDRPIQERREYPTVPAIERGGLSR